MKVSPSTPESDKPTPEELAAQQKAWQEFLAAGREHAKSLPAGHVVDDSRESIYDGRGE